MEPLRAIDTQWRCGFSKWSRDGSVADSHHIDEKLDPDPHQSEIFYLDPDPYRSDADPQLCLEVKDPDPIRQRFFYFNLELLFLGQRGQSFQPLHSSAQAGARPFQSQGNLPGKKARDLLPRICCTYRSVVGRNRRCFFKYFLWAWYKEMSSILDYQSRPRI